jgi:16S rRNA (cytosine1402-N4)-methyltransferase
MRLMCEPTAYHTPVLLAETLDALVPEPGGLYIDGTLGGGGHSAGILARLNGRGMLYGVDRDLDAIAAASKRLSGTQAFEAIHGNFQYIKSLMDERGVGSVNGILLDLGVSSHQLDTPERGFSYHADAPLDMRMDRTRGKSAADLISQMPENELARIFYEYGEERWATRIAKIIVEKRSLSPILNTLQLVACVDAAIPRAVRNKDGGHSSRRVFQALRIAVNDELAPLERALEDAVGLLKPGGRLCVITFHSLEDRIVKRTFARLRRPCICPPSFPICVCGKTPSLTERFHSPIFPGKQEIADNPRSASAKLRIGEKI